MSAPEQNEKGLHMMWDGGKMLEPEQGKEGVTQGKYVAGVSEPTQSKDSINLAGQPMQDIRA